MRGRFDRHHVLGRIEVRVRLDGLHHLRQHRIHMIRIDAGHIEPHAVLRTVRVFRVRDAASAVDLGHDRTAHHVTRGEVAMLRRITFHERLAVGVAQHAALRTGGLRQEYARVRETRRMELDEFDVFQLESGGQRQGHAVAGQIP